MRSEQHQDEAILDMGSARVRHGRHPHSTSIVPLMTMSHIHTTLMSYMQIVYDVQVYVLPHELLWRADVSYIMSYLQELSLVARRSPSPTSSSRPTAQGGALYITSYLHHPVRRPSPHGKTKDAHEWGSMEFLCGLRKTKERSWGWSMEYCSKTCHMVTSSHISMCTYQHAG